ncbi:hypothetical protein [Paracoccus sp. (in: a-proteobacteria)]|nr:hypothetical protein [Paracoccus sp. (in: a-proteobacteria)]MDO5370376.1 hypothetical protein [Paracoccus sp. (in: a-proteobacteria)]
MVKTYSRPVLRVQGQLEAMTHGNSRGNALDNTFQTGTPVSQLTFS